MATRIEYFEFQPFLSRMGKDAVIGLRFKFDAEVVATLKRALAEARETRGGIPAGGWLPEVHRWYVERPVWPWVHDALVAAGHTLVCGRPDDPRRAHQFSTAEYVAISQVIRQWWAELLAEYQGADRELMRALEVARDRLEALLDLNREEVARYAAEQDGARPWLRAMGFRDAGGG